MWAHLSPQKLGLEGTGELRAGFQCLLFTIEGVTCPGGGLPTTCIEQVQWMESF